MLVFKWFALIQVYARCPTSCKVLIPMRWWGNTKIQQVVWKSFIITNNERFVNIVLSFFTIACLVFFLFLSFQLQTFLASFKKEIRSNSYRRKCSLLKKINYISDIHNGANYFFPLEYDVPILHTCKLVTNTIIIIHL